MLRAPSGGPAPKVTEAPVAPPGKQPLSRRFDALPTRVKVAVLVPIAVVVIAIALITGNSSDGQSNLPPKLLPAHKTMVDNLAADGDCAALQARFDAAYENRGAAGSDKAVRNLDLMDYADEAMDRIGCYD